MTAASPSDTRVSVVAVWLEEVTMKFIATPLSRLQLVSRSDLATRLTDFITSDSVDESDLPHAPNGTRLVDEAPGSSR